MAYYEGCKVVSLPCGQNLAGDAYEALTFDSSGRVVKQSTRGDIVVGILTTETGTTVAGDHVPVALIGGGGIMKGKAGAAISAGNILICDSTDGRIAGVADIGSLQADEMGFGLALETAADGQIFSFLAMNVGGPHSA